LVAFRSPESNDRHVLVDPAAGDAAAIGTLRDTWFGTERARGHYARHMDAQIIAVELEKDRFKAAEKRLPEWDSVRNKRFDTVLEADAFHVAFTCGDGASLLFLNPPYDTDPVHGRLEQRFLQRWGPCLLPGDGVLMFLVPYYALKASAGFLAREFCDFRVWRFPDEDFAAFKQCVLVARRRPAALAENDMDRKRIERWADSPESMPPLRVLAGAPFIVRGAGDGPGLQVEKVSLDVLGLVEGFHPWADSPMFGTDRTVNELIGARYEVAMPPRPAHIALALSAGMLNGKRLIPNQGRRLPPILIKGSFRRYFIVTKKKYNKDGELTGCEQEQRPKLTLHVLRLDTLQFHELRPGASPSGATDLADFNSADLVEAYSESLGALMREQFPAIHDPTNPDHAMELPTLGRPSFTIQRHLIAAGLKLVARGENPIAAAEVGTGKSQVSLSIVGSLSPEHFQSTAAELRRQGIDTSRLRPVRRTLIICPPHLLKSWRDQTAAVLPTHRVQIVEDLSDLRQPAEVYVLSRETAKLGHGISGLVLPPAHRRIPSPPHVVAPAERVGRARQCPRCGQLIVAHPDTLASKRERCGHMRRNPVNKVARLAEDLAVVLAPTYPFDPLVRLLVTNRIALTRTLPDRDFDEDDEPPVGPAPSSTKIEALARAVLSAIVRGNQDYRLKAAARYLAAEADILEEVALEARRQCQRYRDKADAAAEKHGRWSTQESRPRAIAESLKTLADQIENPPPHERKPAQPLLEALAELAASGRWEEGEPCPEPLFQAIPQPRRYPIARYLLKHRRQLACNPDFLIIDEAHEYSTQGSAQQKAAHRLVEIPGIPTLALSGSLMGGMASSLFANFWAMSRRFRKAFRRSEKGPFVTRYGYRKVFVPAGREGQVEILGYGSKSDREDQRESKEIRQMGESPGVLPLFILEHLLPIALIMHKEDLEGELPPCREIPVPIEVPEDDATAKEMMAEHQRLISKLGQQIKADMYTKRSGQLFGAMGTVPSYPDRCTEDLPPFLLAYPEDAGGGVVAEGKRFPADWLTPKERWVTARVGEHLAAGRNVLVFLLHTGKSGLPKRWLRLFKEQLGETAIFLDVGKVSAGGREEWLDRNVIEPGRRILITNPKAVQTGLNNLVHFSRAIWVQGVDYDARVVRQANGRVHRIGQKLDVDIEVPFYANTVQKTALDLVARKITASVQVDGLSIEGALESAGAGDGKDEANQAAMGMGQAIYEAAFLVA
jgi:hypothetical protein